jgi:hypothetical protein
MGWLGSAMEEDREGERCYSLTTSVRFAFLILKVFAQTFGTKRTKLNAILARCRGSDRPSKIFRTQTLAA